MSKYSRQKKVSKLESIANRRAKQAYVLQGEGRFVYRNNTSGTLTLPKPPFSGPKEIEVGGTWEGDSYFMFLVNNNLATLVSTITSPEEERNQKMLNEQKLILDQPERVTNKGVTEQVVENPKPVSANKKKEKINEQKPQAEDVLINEDPLEGVTICG